MDTIETSQDLLQGYYGDEQIRLDQFQSTEYTDFKDYLLGTRNSHSSLGHVDSFVDSPNFNLGGKIYPRPEDKDYLLEYALKQAQASGDIQVAAFIMGIAIVFTHPFLDGNGRTSREVYGYLSRGIDASSTEHEKLRKSKPGEMNKIDFSWIDSYAGTLLDRIIYDESVVKPIAHSAINDSSFGAAHEHYEELEYRGLNDEEIRELDLILGEGNRRAVLFGLSMIAKEDGIEFPRVTVKERVSVMVAGSLAVLNGDQKRTLIKYTRDYNTHRAKAAIDLIPKYGNQKLNYENGKISVSDWLVQGTRNYLASRVGRLTSKSVRITEPSPQYTTNP